MRTKPRSRSGVADGARLKLIEGVFNKGEWDSVGGVAEDIQHGELEDKANNKSRANIDKGGQCRI